MKILIGFFWKNFRSPENDIIIQFGIMRKSKGSTNQKQIGSWVFPEDKLIGPRGLSASAADLRFQLTRTSNSPNGRGAGYAVINMDLD